MRIFHLLMLLKALGTASGDHVGTHSASETQAKDVQNLIKFSTHKCTGDDDTMSTLCTFSNIVRWNDHLYYIAQDPSAVKVPKAVLAKLNYKHKETPTANDFIKPISFDEFVALVGDSPKQYEQIKRGIVWTPEYITNWWHTSQDMLKMYWPYCEGFGQCQYSRKAADDTAVLLTSRACCNGHLGHVEREWQASHMLAPKDAFQCFGTRLLNVKPNGEKPTEEVEVAMPDTIFIFEDVLCGTGQMAVEAEAGNTWPPSNTVERRTQLMGYVRSCAGLSPTAAKPRGSQPHVVLLNRAYTAGRSMMRLDELEQMVREARPEVKIQTVLLEGKNLSDQAKVFDQADVMVIAHGAACSNLMFLPHLAAVVHVSHTSAHASFPSTLLERLRPPNDTHEIINIEYMRHGNELSDPIISKIRDSKEFNKLETAEEKLEFILSENLTHKRMNERVANYLLDLNDIFPKVLQAIDQWVEQAKGMS